MKQYKYDYKLICIDEETRNIIKSRCKKNNSNISSELKIIIDYYKYKYNNKLEIDSSIEISNLKQIAVKIDVYNELNYLLQEYKIEYKEIKFNHLLQALLELKYENELNNIDLSDLSDKNKIISMEIKLIKSNYIELKEFCVKNNLKLQNVINYLLNNFIDNLKKDKDE